MGNLVAGACEQASALREEMLAESANYATRSGRCQDIADDEQNQMVAKSYQALLEEVDALQDLFSGMQVELEDQRQHSQACPARPEVALPSVGPRMTPRELEFIDLQNSKGMDCADAVGVGGGMVVTTSRQLESDVLHTDAAATLGVIAGDSSSAADNTDCDNSPIWVEATSPVTMTRQSAHEDEFGFDFEGVGTNIDAPSVEVGTDVDAPPVEALHVCDWTDAVRTRWRASSPSSCSDEVDLDLVDLALMETKLVGKRSLHDGIERDVLDFARMETEMVRQRGVDGGSERDTCVGTTPDADVEDRDVESESETTRRVLECTRAADLEEDTAVLACDARPSVVMKEGDELDEECKTKTCAPVPSSGVERGEQSQASAVEDIADCGGIIFSKIEVVNETASGKESETQGCVAACADVLADTLVEEQDVTSDRFVFKPPLRENASSSSVLSDLVTGRPLSASDLWKCLSTEIPVGSVQASLPDGVSDPRECNEATGVIRSEVVLPRSGEVCPYADKEPSSLPLPRDLRCDASAPLVKEPSSRPGIRAVVRLHVYDVSNDSRVRWLNMALAHKYSPLKFGGVFHVGVEVYGREWCYGYTPHGTGVSWLHPRTLKDHNFRETLELPSTTFSEEQAENVVKSLAVKYTGRSYHLLRRNCCHFADDFCQALQVGSIPGWIHRLSGVGSGAATVLQALAEPLGAMRVSRSVAYAGSVLPAAGAAALPSTPVALRDDDSGQGI
jgi:hypothetical protein